MIINGNILNRQYFQYKQEYDQAYQEVMESGWYILGKKTEEFEVKFAQYIGTKYCIGVNSGLDALSLSIRALGIGVGDEILVPANTYIASLLAITENGATPVFVEPDEYFNMNPEGLKHAVTNKTKAILCVHLFGQACRMDRIYEFAKERNLYLIEDCAQAHGAAFGGKKVGTWGDTGAFSFYPTKNMGAFGDAGAIVTDNAKLAEKIRSLRNYGSQKKYYFQYQGVNSRMDELQAAFLLVKMRHLEEINEERKKIGEHYQKQIKNSSVILPIIAEESEHVFHQYVILTEDRNCFQRFLKDKGIMTQIHYPIPPHLSECYQCLGYQIGAFPITEYYADHMVSLPIYTGMTEMEQKYVVDIVNSY